MNIKIGKGIALKLKLKHSVMLEEVEQCFLNREKGLLEDTREQHMTRPPTLWFIARTDKNRLLKIVFIELLSGGYAIKTAYEPSNKEVKIYDRFA